MIEEVAVLAEVTCGDSDRVRETATDAHVSSLRLQAKSIWSRSHSERVRMTIDDLEDALDRERSGPTTHELQRPLFEALRRLVAKVEEAQQAASDGATPEEILRILER